MIDTKQKVWVVCLWGGFLILAGYLLSSCAAITPTEKAITIEERIAVASINLSGFRHVHADLIESGRVTLSIDKDLVALEKTMQDTIDAATASVRLGNLSTAEGQLKAIKAASDLLAERITQLEGKQ